MVNTHVGKLVAGVRATKIKKKLLANDVMVFLAIDERLHRLEYYEINGDEDKRRLVRILILTLTLTLTLTLNPNLNPKPEPEPEH